MLDKQQYKNAQNQIRKILLRTWDPIGIYEIASAKDEYDSYIPKVIQILIRAEGPKEKVVNYLIGIETGMMGLDGDRVRANKVANKIISWWPY